MLAHIATDDQKQQFLAPPLAAGDVRSAFAMTEPAPGAGADPPNALRTRAEKVSGGWKINGHKHFITGATVPDSSSSWPVPPGGNPASAVARRCSSPPADTPGLKVGRHIGTLDKSMIGGHCEVFFEDLFVPDSAVLGKPDEGFAYAQVRLGPAA